MFLSGKEDVLIVIKDVTSVLSILSILYLIPLIYAIFNNEPWSLISSYLIVGILQFTINFSIWRKIKVKTTTTMKHAFAEITIIWFLCPLLFSIPYVIHMEINFLDAYFEMVSMITTTGLTLMTPYLHYMPESLILWRSFVGWIGGIGIVIMALSSFFIKYTKASRMVIAEGRDDKIRANIKNSTREIFSIYVVLTLLGAFALYFSGLTFFEAINYAMSAISTTGMGMFPNDLSLLNSFPVQLSLILLTIIGATSFSLHYLLFKRKEFFRIFQDSEFLVLLFIGVFVGMLNLQKFDFIQTGILTQSLFHSFSALTGGGFMLVSPEIFTLNSDFMKASLIAAMFIGGSAGSTAGGIKISRAIIFFKSFYWKIKEAIFPKNTLFPKTYEGQEITNDMTKEIFQFILLYGFFIVLTTTIMSYFGMPYLESLFEVTSAQSNVGISVGITAQANPFIKELLIINMILGRLEIIPIFAFLGFLLSLKRGE